MVQSIEFLIFRLGGSTIQGLPVRVPVQVIETLAAPFNSRTSCTVALVLVSGTEKSPVLYH